MCGVRRFFNISESADIRINELLDELETLGIEYSSDEFINDEEIGISGVDIIWYLTNKIFNAFKTDFERYVENVGGGIEVCDLDFEITPFNGTYHVLFVYERVEFDDEFIDSYIVGDRERVFSKLLEKCKDIGGVQ